MQWKQRDDGRWDLRDGAELRGQVFLADLDCKRSRCRSGCTHDTIKAAWWLDKNTCGTSGDVELATIEDAKAWVVGRLFQSATLGRNRLLAMINKLEVMQ